MNEIIRIEAETFGGNPRISFHLFSSRDLHDIRATVNTHG